MTQLQPGMARIRVKDLRVRTYIGIKEEEILNKQDVLINLTILYPAGDAVQQVTDAAGVAVVIEARHMCMMMRGVEKQNSTMNTSVMLGAFRDSSNTRQEFLQLIGRSK